MSQSISDIMKIFEDELKLLGAKIGTLRLIETGTPIDYGKTIQLNITAYINEEFQETQIRALAQELIKKFQFPFSFRELSLPKIGVEIACSCRKGQIMFRYLEAHEIQSDRIIKRIDILV